MEEKLIILLSWHKTWRVETNCSSWVWLAVADMSVTCSTTKLQICQLLCIRMCECTISLHESTRCGHTRKTSVQQSEWISFSSVYVKNLYVCIECYRRFSCLRSQNIELKTGSDFIYPSNVHRHCFTLLSMADKALLQTWFLCQKFQPPCLLEWNYRHSKEGKGWDFISDKALQDWPDLLFRDVDSNLGCVKITRSNNNSLSLLAGFVICIPDFLWKISASLSAPEGLLQQKTVAPLFFFFFVFFLFCACILWINMLCSVYLQYLDYDELQHPEFQVKLWQLG